MSERIAVIFRAVKRCEHKGDVIAIFPDLDANAGRFTCYAHIGQHGECSRQWFVSETRPASPDEYRDLLRELRRIYEANGDAKLCVRKRVYHG